MTMGDRIKRVSGQGTRDIKGASTTMINDPEDAAGGSADDRTADRRPQRLIEDAALIDAPGS
jgi:hypothetical protein